MPRQPRLLLLATLTACVGDPEPATPDTDACPGGDDVDWPAPTTTLVQRNQLGPRLDTPLELTPALPDGLAVAEAAGLGTWEVIDGEPWLLDDRLAPGSGGARSGRSLALFLHQTDAQIPDTESPTRVLTAEDAGPTQAAARPQELHAVHALDALLREIRGLHELAPVDFALVTGDDADSVQQNELTWFRDVWDGVRFTPDSGVNDTQCDADGNDPIATFTPVGVPFPWYAIAGNHDVLVQGNFAPEAFRDDALGGVATFGTRDLGQPGGPLSYTTEPDASRVLLSRAGIAEVLLDSPATPGPAGHGLTADNVAADSLGWSADPVPGVRVIAVDANPNGPGDGRLTLAERDGWLVPELERATDDGVLVIVTSHYALGGTPVEGGGTVGELLQQYPNVILALAGHWHTNHVASYGDADDPGAFWEIVSASTADWPVQGRLIELIDNGDGTLSILCTVVDAPAPEGSLARRQRHLAAIDVQSGWRLSQGEGEVGDRNVELVQRLPAGWSGGREEAVRSTALPGAE